MTKISANYPTSNTLFPYEQSGMSASSDKLGLPRFLDDQQIDEFSVDVNRYPCRTLVLWGSFKQTDPLPLASRHH